MEYKLPFRIENGHGEVVTFTKVANEPNGEKLFFEAIVQPNSGPVEHIHLKQDEYFEVVKGQMFYELGDNTTGDLTAGQSVILPLTYVVGKLSGEYKKYKNAPKPI